MARKYLIVVDMQEDFVYGPLGTPEARKILPNVIEKVKKLCRYRHAHERFLSQQLPGYSGG